MSAPPIREFTLAKNRYERIGSDDNPLADSIMDRIKYDAYKIKVQAIDPDRDKLMREVYGLSPEEAE